MLSEKIVTEVVAQLLDVDEAELAMDRRLAEIEGWDSVNLLRVLVYLERELGSSLDYERFAAAEALGDLAAIVAGTVAPEGA
ncbi:MULTISPECIES: acyl carrier protein [unclassified Frankia]